MVHPCSPLDGHVCWRLKWQIMLIRRNQYMLLVCRASKMSMAIRVNTKIISEFDQNFQRNGGFHSHGGTSKSMVYFMENPIYKWIIWGCPYFRKSPNLCGILRLIGWQDAFPFHKRHFWVPHSRGGEPSEMEEITTYVIHWKQTILANKLGLNTCFREHGVPKKAMLGHHFSYQILKLPRLIPHCQMDHSWSNIDMDNPLLK